MEKTKEEILPSVRSITSGSPSVPSVLSESTNSTTKKLLKRNTSTYLTHSRKMKILQFMKLWSGESRNGVQWMDLLEDYIDDENVSQADISRWSTRYRWLKEFSKTFEDSPATPEQLAKITTPGYTKIGNEQENSHLKLGFTDFRRPISVPSMETAATEETELRNFQYNSEMFSATNWINPENFRMPLCNNSDRVYCCDLGAKSPGNLMTKDYYTNTNTESEIPQLNSTNKYGTKKELISSKVDSANSPPIPIQVQLTSAQDANVPDPAVPQTLMSVYADHTYSNLARERRHFNSFPRISRKMKLIGNQHKGRSDHTYSAASIGKEPVNSEEQEEVHFENSNS